MKKKNNNSGFTLVETMIALAIVGILLAAGVSVFAFGPRSFTTQVNSLADQYRVRDVTRNISRDTRKADTDSIIADPEYLQIDDIVYTFSNGSVYREDVEIAGGIQTFDYSVTDNHLIVEVASADNGGEGFSLTIDIYIRNVGQ